MLSGNTFEAWVTVNPGANTSPVTARDGSGNVKTNNYQLDVGGTGANYTYDPNGNLNQRVEGAVTWTYEWNAENQLTRILNNGNEVARFKYDALGRRVEKVPPTTTTTWTYDSQHLLREVSGATTLKYVHGSGIDEPLAQEDGVGALTFFHADGLGSIVKTTDTVGTITATRRYDAFGNLELGAAPNGYAFTGREWNSEAGLYYYRSRYYDPKLGRFISEDPIRFDAGVNFYAYVEDNPVNATDPSGLVAGGNWKNKCGNATPLSPNDPTACKYGDLKVDLILVEWDLDCVCKNAGDDAGANCVRACIQCAKESGEDVTKISPHSWCKSQCRAKGVWTNENDKTLNDLINQKCTRCWFQGR